MFRTCLAMTYDMRIMNYKPFRKCRRGSYITYMRGGCTRRLTQTHADTRKHTYKHRQPHTTLDTHTHTHREERGCIYYYITDVSMGVPVLFKEKHSTEQ